MRRSLLNLLLILLCACLPLWAHAGALAVLMQRAVETEPGLQAASADYHMAEARHDQARGSLLPQLTASASTSMNRREYETLDSPFPAQEDEFNAHSSQLNLTQPLWHYANWAAYAQARYVRYQAWYKARSSKQELLAKVVDAWFELLMARDEVVFSGKQEEAARQEWQVARRGAELGTMAEPQAQMALARYQQAQADKLAAESDQLAKQAALEQWTGAMVSMALPFLQERVVELEQAPEAQSRWLQRVSEHNPSLAAARMAQKAAQEGLSREQAGYQPTIDLVASYKNDNQHVGSTPLQSGYESKQNSVALQLNMSLFSGGTQSAKVAEARAALGKSRFDLDAAWRSVELGAKQGWLAWQASALRIGATHKTTQAAALAWHSAQRANRSGLKSMLDVLQAERDYLSAWKDWNKARYKALSSAIRLKSLTGMLTEKEILQLDSLFQPSADNSLQPSADNTGVL